MNNKPTRKQIEIRDAMIAGFDGDSRAFTRLIARHKAASYEDLRQAWLAGRRQREASDA